MKKYSPYVRASFWGIGGIILSLLARNYLQTQDYSDDLGSISNMIALFGVLFGLLLAFVVFEAWKQYTDLSNCVVQEATGCERLFRTYRYFRDKKSEEKFKESLVKYLQAIVSNNFKANAKGGRNVESSTAFREISEAIQNVPFNDSHDSVVFAQLLQEYASLSEVRNTRVSLAITRLPALLKSLIQILMVVALGMVVLMPFSNIFYQVYFSFSLFFFLAFLRFLIMDLDNPFVGYWNVTTNEYKRAISNLKSNY